MVQNERASAAEVAEIADRLAIDDLLTRYAQAIDTKDYALLQSVFAPDAVLDYTSAGAIQGGYDEVVGWLEKALANFPTTQHFVTNRTVALEGDRATSHSYFYNPMGWKSDDDRLRVFFVGGYYDDRLERRSEGWRIVERVVETAWYQGEFPPGFGRRA
jgi:3-phenylpropionate/cinnamic acid dioxygenase small subunit